MKKIIIFLLFLLNINTISASMMSAFIRTNNISVPNGKITLSSDKKININSLKNKVVVLTLWDKSKRYSIEQLMLLNDLAKHFTHDIFKTKKIEFIAVARKAISKKPAVPQLKGLSEKQIFEKLKIYNVSCCKTDKKLENFFYLLAGKKDVPITIILNKKMKCIGFFKMALPLERPEVAHFIQKLMDNKIKTRHKKTWFTKIIRYINKLF